MSALKTTTKRQLLLQLIYKITTTITRQSGSININ